MSKTPDEILEIRRKIAARHEWSKTLSNIYPRGIVLRNDNPNNDTRPWTGAAIAPSTWKAGRWQVTIFDQDGFAYDYSEATYADAIFQALNEGYRQPDMELLDTVGGTTRFMAGVIWSMLPEDKKWSTRLADVRAELEAVTP
jgi:hypothetical protein